LSLVTACEHDAVHREAIPFAGGVEGPKGLPLGRRGEGRRDATGEAVDEGVDAPGRVAGAGGAAGRDCEERRPEERGGGATKAPKVPGFHGPLRGEMDEMTLRVPSHSTMSGRWHLAACGAWAALCGCATDLAPVLAAPGDRVVSAGQAVELRLSARDPEGERVAYGARGLPPGARLIPEPGTGTAVFQWIPLASDAAPGGRAHVVTFIAQDPNGGRAEARATLVVQSVDTLPRFTSPRSFVLHPGEALDAALVLRDDDSARVDVSLVAGPPGALVSADPAGARLRWTAPDAAAAALRAVYAFDVAAEDENGAEGRVVQRFQVVVLP
jgi:hypothetical protein